MFPDSGMISHRMSLMLQRLEQQEHIRRSRTLANQDIIRILAEGKKKTKLHSEVLITKLQWQRKCQMDITDFGRYEQGVVLPQIIVLKQIENSNNIRW